MTLVLTAEKISRKGLRKFKRGRLSAPRHLTLRNLLHYTKVWQFRTSISFSMLASRKMVGVSPLKRGTGYLGFKSSFLAWRRKEKYEYKAVYPSSRHSGKEKVTLDDLFLLHSIDGGVSVDIPWHVAKFLCDKAKGSKKKSPIVEAHLIKRIARYYGLMTLGALINVTFGPETSFISVTKLVDLGIYMYNGLGIGEMVAEILEVAGDDDAGVGQAEIGGCEMPPQHLVSDVDELTYVVSGMSEQYDQFYKDFGQWQTEQERFHTWNTDHLSQLLAHHHIDHTCYDGTPYYYVPTIPNLEIIMENLPPPNHVADLPEDDPEEQPELAPEPDHLNVFEPHQIPQPEGNMNGWILEDDDDEEEEEEDPEMEEEMEEENDDYDDAEVINPYEEADPLNLPPPDSDTESEDTAVAPTPDEQEQEAESATVGTITRVPYSVRPFSGTIYVGTGPSRRVFAPGPTSRDVNTLHHQFKGLAQQMFDRANTKHSTLKRLSVMDKYLAEFDSDLRGQIKGQHALRRNVCTLEDQVRELVKGDREENKKLKMMLESTQRDFDRLPYVAPTAPVTPVDRANPDDPSPHPTGHPRHDEPYVMVRDAATRDEGDDTATTSDPQPS
ncbi:hypothetical protein Tco_1018260 [Tanacetum coccineum]|uniref:Uncharacterized protein n=1 Tax=Tanacetum coccineum TaxID=301880 RepID=A0ABQ5FV95_9ASTR